MNHSDQEINFNFIKNKVIKYFVSVGFTGFSIFYIFGALLLWQYLDIQGLRGEFTFSIGSNNLLISFALLGVFAASIIVFYLFYAQSLLKSIIRDSRALNNEKSIGNLLKWHFSVLFIPLFILLVLESILKNITLVFLLCAPIVHLIGYSYWLSIKGISFNRKRIKHCLKSALTIKGIKWIYRRNKKVIPYTALVIFFAFYNIMPLFIIINIIERLDVGEITSLLYLSLSFAFYSLLIAGLSVLKNRLYSLVAIIFILFCSLFVVLSFPNVPLNTAKTTGFGHYCTDIVLKKEEVTPALIKLLNKKKITLDESTLTLFDVYVLLHKDGKEYIVSRKQGSPAEYIPYAIVERKGFFKACPKDDLNHK